MNSLYTTGVRQTNSLQADLERLRNGDNSAALLGEYALRRPFGYSANVMGLTTEG